MQLSGFNLNHLVALDALLRERHVGRAAGRVGVTQSAMSHTLRTLREAMGDPLMVRMGNNMVLTPYAEQVRERLQRGLTDLESVLSGRAAFDPATITDSFTLSTLDGIAAMVSSSLWSELNTRAPEAGLRLAPLDPARLHQQLESGNVDVAAVPPIIDLSGLETEPLENESPTFREQSVVCRKGHPGVGKRLTLSRYCKLPHAVLSVTGEGPSFIDHVLAERGLSREVKVRVPYTLAMAELLASSDLLVTTITAMADFFLARWPLQKFPLPFEAPVGPLIMCWHPRYSADPAHRFFRDVIRRACLRSTSPEGPNRRYLRA